MIAPGRIGVLIVDDHAIVRAGLRRLFDTERDIVVVGEAAGGIEALRALRKLHPDVVLLDLSMPEGDGLQLLEQLRAERGATRVLVFTMHEDPVYLHSAVASGADGVVLKRDPHATLIAAIRTVARGRRFVDGTAGAPLPEWRGRPLSPRERRVLQLLAEGHSSNATAARLSLSVKTIETYRARLSQKLGARSRAELVRHALSRGLLDPEQAWKDGGSASRNSSPENP